MNGWPILRIGPPYGNGGGRIGRLRFKTYGCPPAIAAGSAFTQMAEGMRVQEALAITHAQLIAALWGLRTRGRALSHNK